jgi:hypothetical protein
MGIDTSSQSFVKLLFSALPSDSVLSVEPDGDLRLHVQYIPVSQLDVSGDFLLHLRAAGIDASVTTFVRNLVLQSVGKDGAS